LATTALAEYTEFVCVEEIDVMNENRVCLLSSAYLATVLSQCGQGPPRVDPCHLLKDTECQLRVTGEVCSQEVADKLRGFVERLQSQIESQIGSCQLVGEQMAEGSRPDRRSGKRRTRSLDNKRLLMINYEKVFKLFR
jgi:hypothetical protein